MATARRRAGLPSKSKTKSSSGATVRATPLLRLALVLTAGALALTPPPAPLVERWYAGLLYPSLQATVTGASNLLPVAVFDVLLVLLLVAPILVIWRGVRRVRQDRSIRPAIRAAGTLLVFAAAVYLWFLFAWGLSYARAPIEARLDLRDVQVTTEDVRALAAQAVTIVNDTHGAAHAAGFPAIHAVPAPLVDALVAVDFEHGRVRPTVPGRPKATVLGWFFRAAGVDGMIAPLALETLVNTALTPPERPFVLAHEWAHLSGHADEADANFVAWLVTTRADVPSLYSGWLYVVNDAASQLPPGDRAEVLAALAPGPRADLEAIAARVASRVEVVQHASWQVYDQYLRTQGVDDGVRSYSRGIQLIVKYGAR